MLLNDPENGRVNVFHQRARRAVKILIILETCNEWAGPSCNESAGPVDIHDGWHLRIRPNEFHFV